MFNIEQKYSIKFFWASIFDFIIYEKYSLCENLCDSKYIENLQSSNSAYTNTKYNDINIWIVFIEIHKSYISVYRFWYYINEDKSN